MDTSSAVVSLASRIFPASPLIFFILLPGRLSSMEMSLPEIHMEAMATDAFTLDLKAMKAYANPPRSVVGRVLHKYSNRRQT